MSFWASWIALALASQAGEGSFRAGPYLLDVTSEAATVAFYLDAPTEAKVRVSDGEGWRTFASEKKSRSHFVRVSGLAPARRYIYEVVCADGDVRTPEGDGSFQIRTACLPGESFTFAVYGDPRPGDTRSHRHHRDVLAQTVRTEPAFCLVLGDMVDEGEKKELWEDFFHVESELVRRAALFPVMGDNDYAGGRGLYADYFPRLERGYYRFEWGGVQFFGMRAWDARGSQPRRELDAESPQLRWLTAELSKERVRRAPFRVVFLHDPVYICRGRSAELLRRVWALLFRKHGVDVVFASWHMYERSRHEGVTYIISGGAGAELIWMKKDPVFPSQADARAHHFCRVDVSAGAMTIRAIATDGTVLDFITLAPRSLDRGVSGALERASRRLRREIVIPGGDKAPELPLQLFSYDCGYCRKLLGHELPRWSREHGVSLRVHYYDLGLRGTYDLLVAAGADFGRQGAEIPAVFIGRSVLGGELEINGGLPRELRAFRKNPQLYRERAIVPFRETHDTKTMQEKAFQSLTAGVVAGAGLLDGVNPCAFTTVIFLISYLSMVGGRRRQMLATGGLFTLGVFLAYLLIGLTFFHFARWVLGGRTAARIVNWVLLLVVSCLAGLSAVDFVRCLRGRATEMSLQLPRFLKDRIRGRIRDFARNELAMGAASFGLGVVIAGMELACTGQVYIPIVTMVSEPRFRAAAVSYLLVYNVAFILPLAAVFLMAALGVPSRRMGKFFQRHVATVKLGLTLLFVAMAAAIVHNLRWT